jgi:hypothetical protein
MRRLSAWVGGALGGLAAYRWLRGRPQVTTEPPPAPAAPATDERAEELRAKLAESRESAEPSPAEPSPAEPSPAETSPSEAGETLEAVEERRHRVHDEARAALDEMKSDGAAPESS